MCVLVGLGSDEDTFHDLDGTGQSVLAGHSSQRDKKWGNDTRGPKFVPETRGKKGETETRGGADNSL